MNPATAPNISDFQEALWLDSNDSATDLSSWNSMRRLRNGRVLSTSNTSLAPSEQDVLASSSTDLPPRPAHITKSVMLLFANARDEVFEAGFESDFSKGVLSIVRAYRNLGVDAVRTTVLWEGTNQEIAAEALRWLGYFDDATTHSSRLWLLERCLFNASARIRNAAALGLASLDDPRAIIHLKEAIEKENDDELREDMLQVLAQLESTRRCDSY
jgi:hypothetical protein